jgi:hypothetical protein
VVDAPRSRRKITARDDTAATRRDETTSRRSTLRVDHEIETARASDRTEVACQ